MIPAGLGPVPDAAPLAGLHIALLTASASRLGGGVASAVGAQARMIAEAGGAVTVVALEDTCSEADRATLAPARLLTARVRGPAQIGYAPGLVDLLLGSDADLLHLHGIWMYPSRAATVWGRRTGRPVVVSPHGMLDPWITARGRWKKALARAFYERRSWHSAAALHALTEDEAADILREAGERPVMTIPNAGPLARTAPPEGREAVVLYLGRIHPKKNLDALLDGWARAKLPKDARLVIAGWGEPGDVAAFEDRVAQAPSSVRFVGPAHGADKQRLLEQARFMVLPSHSEGLPMAVLEAWAAGTPAILTPACHLPEGFACGAALQCGTDAASIARVIEQALALDSAGWARMTEAALALARGRFSSTSVAREWATAYRQLAAAPPL